MYDILTFGFYFLMQFHAKFQDISWCPNGARSEKTMLHRVMDTNNKIRKKPVFTGFLRTIYAALCGNIRGFSRFTPLEIKLSARARGFESHPLRHAAVSDDLLTAIFNSGAYASLFYLKGVPKGVRQRFCPLGTWGAYAACLALGCGGKSPALGKGRIGAIQRRIWYSKDGLLG